MSRNRMSLRRTWFQIHKWLGLLLLIALIPVSLSGSALVWHDWLDERLNPQRHSDSRGDAVLVPSAYVAAARERLGKDERVATLRFEEDGPALLAATRPLEPGEARPARTNVWLDSADARVVDVAGSNAGVVRFLHVFHGSLMMPGVGRQIVGWLGVAMLISSLSGLWLWWPTIGSWRRGLRWRRTNDTNTNLHHQAGFWVAIPLAMLSLTGAWISFPAFFGPLVGAPAPDPAERAARLRAQPLADTRLDVDAAVAAAMSEGNRRPVSISWPTDQAEEWKIAIAGAGKPANYTVNDTTGAVARAEESGGGGGGVARTMRRWHDGTGMGIVWQVLIFVGGVIPVLLGVTGLIMWLRSRGWRAAASRRRKLGSRPLPAE